jgi:hypothetical protein
MPSTAPLIGSLPELDRVDQPTLGSFAMDAAMASSG